MSVMVVSYHKLPDSRRGRKGGLPVRAWLLVRRAATKVARLYTDRQKLAMKCVRRVTWAGLCGRLRVAMRRPKSRRPANYDSIGYALNFDDGQWKEDEDGFWRAGSFACRFGYSGRFR